MTRITNWQHNEQRVGHKHAYLHADPLNRNTKLRGLQHCRFGSGVPLFVPIAKEPEPAEQCKPAQRVLS